jgi:hypothetical protein
MIVNYVNGLDWLGRGERRHGRASPGHGKRALGKSFSKTRFPDVPADPARQAGPEEETRSDRTRVRAAAYNPARELRSGQIFLFFRA